MNTFSNFVNQLNQACGFKIKKTLFKSSKLIANSCLLLYRLGYILNFRVGYKFVIIRLKYSIYGSVIRGFFVLSKPSLKFFIGYKKLSKYSFNNMYGLNGFMALSTNRKKILLDIECIFTCTGGNPLWVVY